MISVSQKTVFPLLSATDPSEKKKKINSLNVQVPSNLIGFFFYKKIKSSSFAIKINNKGKKKETDV